MTDKELVNKIKGLKEIKPSDEWLDFTRQDLIAHLPQAFNLAMPALGFCLLLMLLGGPWLAIKASQPSVPGEMLYSVKRISEGVQSTVASENGKVKLEAEFASRRIKELSKITEDSFTQEEKVEKAKQVVADFSGNLAGISQYVAGISKKEAVVVAKKAQKIKKELDRTKEEAPVEVQTELAEAEKTIEEINHQILAVLAEGTEPGQESATSTDEEILIYLESETETTTDELIDLIE